MTNDGKKTQLNVIAQKRKNLVYEKTWMITRKFIRMWKILSDVMTPVTVICFLQCHNFCSFENRSSCMHIVVTNWLMWYVDIRLKFLFTYFPFVTGTFAFHYFPWRRAIFSPKCIGTLLSSLSLRVISGNYLIIGYGLNLINFIYAIKLMRILTRFLDHTVWNAAPCGI